MSNDTKRKTMTHWLSKSTEAVAAGMLALIFLTFILQIFSRYVLQNPMSWTLELCLTLWVWVVFWGNAFVVKHKDHITFDMIYSASSQKLQKTFALIGSMAIIVGLGVSIGPTWDYIDFLKIKKSASIGIPLRTVFSIYLVFLVVTVLAHAFRSLARLCFVLI